ncbi:hypothetical protein [Sphingomonas sp. TDK1]|uniref:hypothetical protein n=1 Tax=Sphingomonas sp. TDK1 TaxID=453247 RepID=UPI0007D92CDB|nr:hypothetical protein [Sphingomonas sp. TDK1]OAN67120.1 hypothetical protein A7X12_00360 [Sphingomonas sp. TDK1]
MNDLTVYVPIKSGQVESLRSILQRINDNKLDNDLYLLQEDRLTHSSRWVIVDDDPGRGPQLLLAAEFDGELDDYLRHQMAITPGLDEIWSHCEGYAGRAHFIDFIRSNAFPTQAFYIAFPDETVASIRAKIAVRERLEGLLDRAGPVAESTAAVLAGMPNVRTPWQKVGDFLGRVRQNFHDAWLSLLLAIIKPISQIGQTKNFSRVTSFVKNPLTPRAQQLTDLDGQMVTITTIKPWRYPRLWLAFWINQFLGRFGWAPGLFADVGNLHSFRWVLIDNRKRLIFLSVYDGSWQNYMGDFIDKIIWALDGVYNNTFGYPKGGMRDVTQFQRWILNHQYQPQLFYRAYPEESVLNLIRDRTSNNTLAQMAQAGLALESAKVRDTLNAL